MKEKDEKRILNSRPLVFVVLLYAAGILAGIKSEFLLPIIVVSALLIVFFTIASRCSWQCALAMALAFTVGYLYVSSPRFRIVNERENDRIEVSGKIVSSEPYESVSSWGEKRWVVVVRPLSSSAILDKNIRLYVSEVDDAKERLAYGTRISFTAKISSLPPVSNEHQIDSRVNGLRDGVGYTAFLKRNEIIFYDRERDMYSWSADLRRSITSFILQSVEDRGSGGVIVGILLGDKSEIEEDTLKNYRDNGIAHILAVSGLHVGFVAAAVRALLRKLRMKPGWIFAVTAVLLTGYCFLTAFSASTVRASVMALVLIGAGCAGEKYDPLSALALAAGLILSVNPLQLTDVGFVLSFSAVTALVVFGRGFAYAFRRLPLGIAQTFAALLAVQIGVLPWTAYFFGQVPLIGIVVNLLAVPVAAVVVVGGLLSCFLGALIPQAGAFLFKLISYAVEGLTAVSEWISGLPGAYTKVLLFSPLLLLVYGVVAFLCSELLICRKKTRLLSILAAVVLSVGVFFGASLSEKGRVRVVLFATGNSDSLLITDGVHHYLVDTATESAASRILVPYLRGKGISHLDGIFITHDNNDHTGGLAYILQYVSCDGIYGAEGSAFNYGDTYRALKAGERIESGELCFYVVSEPLPERDENANSLVFFLLYHDFSMLFTGDIGFESEKGLIPRIAGHDCDIVKAAHHGSKYSFSEEFLLALGAELALIPAKSVALGENSMAQRLSDTGTSYLCTGEKGMITVRVDPDGTYSIKTFWE